MQVSISDSIFEFCLVILEEYFSVPEISAHLQSWIHENGDVYIFKIPEIFVLSISVD